MVGPELDGERIDRALPALADLSRRRSRALLDAGEVWLNARACRVASRVVRLGDVIDVLFEGSVPEAVRAPQSPPILHEDGWLVAVDKPRGMNSQPPRNRPTARLSLHEAVVLAISFREGRRAEMRLFHRLDRITSGVILLTRNHQAARGLARAWAAGEAVKRYLAVVLGVPPSTFEVDEPIGADRHVPGRFRVERSGRGARTVVRRLAAGDEVSLVEVRPLTGRTHQVRVHLAHRGHPVVGDSLYGGGTAPPGPFLHAWRLEVPHPRDGRRLSLEAPLPSDLAGFLAERGLAPPGAWGGT